MLTEPAPAKINLYLHVTGKRADGYHLLDSLVVFAAPNSDAADRVELEAAPAYALKITGPAAGSLAQEDVEKNLVTRALRALAAKINKPLHFSVILHKNLPVASGIGGGSSDAAAALRAAAKFWKIPKTHPAVVAAARETGADVYPCLLGDACYLAGTGHEVAPTASPPGFFLLLVNPGVPLSTAPVFAARRGVFSDAARLDPMPKNLDAFLRALAERRNDLQEPACGLCPAIPQTLSLIQAQQGCLLARMSGSGASCFGIFAQEEEARRAAEEIGKQKKDYWLAVTGIGD